MSKLAAPILALAMLAAAVTGAQAQMHGGVIGGNGGGCQTGTSTAIQKGNGSGGCAAAASGTDYQAPITGNAPQIEGFSGPNANEAETVGGD
jgi:hypothetical protein